MRLPVTKFEDCLLHPEVFSGRIYPDNWTTPYLSVNFQNVPIECKHLLLKTFRPPISPITDQTDITQKVVVRSMLDTLAEFEFSKMTGETIEKYIRLPARDMALPLHISLRVSPPLRPGHTDRRMLGLVLLALSPVQND